LFLISAIKSHNLFTNVVKWDDISNLNFVSPLIPKINYNKNVVDISFSLNDLDSQQPSIENESELFREFIRNF